jgi:2-methylisocitrate lyase-like PEP mutase family enzyme
VLPQGCDSPDDAKKAKAALPTYRSYNQSHAAGKAKMTLKEVEAMGYTTCSFPSAALFAAVGGVKRAMQALKRDMSFAAVENEIEPLESYYDIVRLKRHNDLEQQYVEQAEAMVARKKRAAE